MLAAWQSHRLHRLVQRLMPFMQRDFIKDLPVEVALRILAFTDPRTIGRCATVSRIWHLAATDPSMKRKDGTLTKRLPCRGDSVALPNRVVSSQTATAQPRCHRQMALQRQKAHQRRRCPRRLVQIAPA